MNVRVVRAVQEIDRELWDRLCDDPAFSYGWFRALEESGVVDAEPRHLVLEADGRVVGILPCVIQRSDPYYTLADRLFGPLAPWLARCGVRVLPALLAYSPLTHRTELFLAPGTDRVAAIRACADAMQRICLDERLPVSGWMFVSGMDAPLRHALRRAGFSDAFLCPTANWTNRYRSFDEHLRDIRRRSLNNYKNVRNELNHHAASGVRLALEPLAAIDSLVLADMRAVLYARYNPGKANPFSPAFFDALKRHMSGQIIARTARSGEELLRYGLTIKGARCWYELMDGEVGDQRSHAHDLQFNINFHFPMRLAIESGVPELRCGLASYLAKVKRGCTLSPLHVAIRGHTRLLRWSLPGWMRLVHRWSLRKHRAFTPFYAAPPAAAREAAWTPADPLWTQVFRAWRQLGPGGFRRLASRKLAEVIGERVIVEGEIPVDPAKPIPAPATELQPEIRRLAPGELAFLRPITSRAMYRRFEGFAGAGYRCYAAFVCGEVAAYQWYSERAYYNPTMQMVIPLLPQELFSVYSHTLRTWRGQGLATQLRAAVLRDAQREGFQSIRSTIEESNRDSLGVVIPWGFRPCRQYRIRRALWWRRVRIEPLHAGPDVFDRLSDAKPFRAPHAGAAEHPREVP
jgi:predicted N-acyltransferase/L-amino acid N-acyltransferase YncA